MSTGGSATDSDASKWMKENLPNCQAQMQTPGGSQNGSINDYMKCFKDLENISCKDIKDLTSIAAKDKDSEQMFVTFANNFNKNKDQIEEAANSLSHILRNTKCMLKEVNNQILTGKDDPKFDLNEVDEIRDIVIKNIGGVTQKQHRRTIIGGTIIISILVIVMFILVIMDMKK